MTPGLFRVSEPVPDRDLPKYKELTAEKRPKPCFFDLSQDAQQRPNFDTKGSLPCLRRGTALWHDPTRRHVTPIELGAVMGFPTFQAGADNAGVPLDVCRDMYGMGELGNTMHVSSVGAILGIALACAEPSQMCFEFFSESRTTRSVCTGVAASGFVY